MRNLVYTVVLAATLPVLTMPVQASTDLTAYLKDGYSVHNAVVLAIAADSELSPTDALRAAFSEGASLISVMNISLSISSSQQDAVAAVTIAATEQGIAPSVVLEAAQDAGVPGDIAAAGIRQGMATAGGVGLDVREIAIPSPSANAGQPISPAN